MMPEPDPRAMWGSSNAANDPDPEVPRPGDDLSTLFPTRNGHGPPEDEPVVDLREPPAHPPPVPPAGVAGAASVTPPPGVAGTASPPAPPPAVAVERRSPDVVAALPPPSRTAPSIAPLDTRAPVSGSLARRVMFAAAPVALVLLVGLVLSALLVARGASAHDRASERAESIVAEQRREASTERLSSAVLAAVASGVGQPTQDAARVQELAAEARADRGADPALSAVDPLADQVAAADRATAELVEGVAAATDRAQESPVELGNELEELERLRVLTRDASRSLVLGLEDLAAQDRAAARTSWWAALGAMGLSVVAAAIVALLVRRRLRAGLDRPLSDLHAAVARVGGATPAGPTSVRGFAELAELGVELDRTTAVAQAELAVLRRRAEWGEQSRRVLEALELAEDEPAAHRVLDRALSDLGAEHPIELLLADRGSTQLARVAANRTVAAPGCPVDTVASCVALRRGKVSVFDDSTSINACPLLADRPYGPCSAACVPVSVGGRPVGVLHLTAPQGRPPDADLVEQVVDLATQAGTRFSGLRALERSRQEAATDGLTGLPNRRTLEAEVAELFERGTPFVMVLADLDKFKRLNDNFGHEVGDKALQLFAGVLRDNVRGNDVVARLGGEEFVLVYPTMSVEISLEAIDRLRGALARALAASNLPEFTCSFGIAHSSVAADGDAVLRIADAGLLQAKDLGGDQAVVADVELAQEIFRDGAPPRVARDDRR
jgi:diguanylate cyclase (GGDEF)-like protein